MAYSEGHRVGLKGHLLQRSFGLVEMILSLNERQQWEFEEQTGLERCLQIMVMKDFQN